MLYKCSVGSFTLSVCVRKDTIVCEIVIVPPQLHQKEYIHILVMYRSSAVHPPSIDDLEKIADDLHLGIDNKQLGEFKEIINKNLKWFDVLDDYVEPTLPVKYPRTPGYRPQRADNKYNAWYYKTDIPGAAEGPLKGYKVVVKDSFPVAGVPMMHGSRVVEGYVPDYDPTVVTRVLDAGATVTGKAVCEAFCYSGSSFMCHPRPVLNPNDMTRSSGGSSSGCAVLVATGDCDMALGGDQGGSIRMPCSWTGIVGLKPTYGLVPYTGLPCLSPAIDSCGPMARTVKDCAKLLEAIAGDDDGLDMRQRRIPDSKDLPKYSQLLTGDVAGKRIGLVKEGFDSCEEDVASVIDSAAKRLQEKGAIVEEVSIPIHADGLELFIPTSLMGAHSVMLQSQGYSYGPPGYLPTSAIDNYIAYMKARSHDLPEPLKLVQLQGKYILDNYGMRYYAKSQNLCRLLRQKYNEALDRYDVLVMPTMKYKAPKLPSDDLTTEDIWVKSVNMLPNTCPFNASGHPAITINAGFSQGLPVGMQIAGRHLEDGTVLNVAYAYEQLLKLESKEAADESALT